MFEILIEPRYLTHEGGTKFYEVIQLYSVIQKRFVLVRRWGKMALRNGGGETKIESFGDLRRCQQASDRILADKSKRGYSRATMGFGLHGVERTSADKLRAALSQHYNDRDAVEQIVSMLGSDETASHVDSEDVIEEGFEVKPEPVRDADWGSW